MSALTTADMTLGDRVVDASPSGAPSPMRVVDLPETTAEEHYIEAIGQTVAKVNDDYPADDSVVGVVFESSLRDDWSEKSPADAKQAAEAVRTSGNVTVYHFPASRTNPVSEDWQPTRGASRSSSKRERAKTFEGHEGAVSMFVQDLRRALSEPEDAAGDLLDAMSVDAEVAGVENAERVMIDMASPNANVVSPRSTDDTPRTRGECGHSRNDKYRPENDNAMCCWECSNRPHNRPEKFERQDPAGTACSGKAQSPWKLRESVVKNIDLSGLPDGLQQTYGEDSRRLLRDITALRSGDEDRIRKAALRLAYRPHLGAVEEYNYHRTVALLRDRGVAAELPIIGDNGGDSQ